MHDALKKFEIHGAISFLPGCGGLPSAKLTLNPENSVELTFFGAQIVSWICNGKERLFLSGKSVFDGKKAIRGGIPIVFPQFGAGEMPSHGFARILNWDVSRSARNDDGSLTIALKLSTSDQTRKFWPAEFSAELEYRLSDKLRTTMRVTNNGVKELSFQNAFHSYFAVKDIMQTAVQGLSGKTFLDSTKKREPGQEDRPEITFGFETDRVYQRAPASLRIVDSVAKGGFEISTSGSQDAVVWNPWIERCAQIADFSADDYKRFVCVEPGNVSESVILAPGATAECSQVISCL